MQKIKIKNKGGRPKIENPRTVVSEVYLTPDEAQHLKDFGKSQGFPFLSQFLRVAAFALIQHKGIGLDAKSAAVSASLGSIASDINALHHIASKPGMPEAAFLISSSALQKIRQLNTLIQQ